MVAVGGGPSIAPGTFLGALKQYYSYWFTLSSLPDSKLLKDKAVCFLLFESSMSGTLTCLLNK